MCPEAVVVSNVNVACIKCIKDADSHICKREGERGGKSRGEGARCRGRQGQGAEEERGKAQKKGREKEELGKDSRREEKINNNCAKTICT